jgi:Sec-independent protein translocase protein TatA
MISFSQFFILLLIAFLLFGDIRKILNSILLIFVNLKSFFKKKDEQKKSDD